MFANDPRLQTHLISGGNYGVVGGFGLVIADADTQELRRIFEEKLIVNELENNNKALRDAVAQLESKMKKLETRLKQSPEEPMILAPPKETQDPSANPASSDKKETKSAETQREELQENVIIVEAIDNESLAENQEDLKAQKEKKEHRFF